MRVTLRDVAQAAGVSPATASRALSAPDLVAPDRREHVVRVARELGYRPHRAARELATGRTGQLCLVVPDLANPFFAGVAKGVQSRARDLGLAVVVADGDEDARLEAELVDQLAAQVDGVIFCSPRMPNEDLADAVRVRRSVLVNRDLPADATTRAAVGTDDSTSPDASVPTVAIDAAGGVEQAVEHLVALGHRTVAYAGGPASSWSDARRHEGLRRAVARHAPSGLEVEDLGHFAPTFDGGGAAGDLVLARGATAVIAHNDMVALGLVDRLRRRGVDVPGDVSVVGFDDTPSARIVWPPLTTVSVPLARLGRAAVDALLDDGPTHHTQLDVALVVRGSTAPPPAR